MAFAPHCRGPGAHARPVDGVDERTFPTGSGLAADQDPIRVGNRDRARIWQMSTVPSRRDLSRNSSRTSAFDTARIGTSVSIAVGRPLVYQTA